jgi:hypothetical protein
MSGSPKLSAEGAPQRHGLAGKEKPLTTESKDNEPGAYGDACQHQEKSRSELKACRWTELRMPKITPER